MCTNSNNNNDDDINPNDNVIDNDDNDYSNNDNANEYANKIMMIGDFIPYFIMDIIACPRWD